MAPPGVVGPRESIAAALGVDATGQLYWVGNANLHHDGSRFVADSPGNALPTTELSTPFDSNAPSIALTSTLRPVVAWLERLVAGDALYIRQYDGEQWSEYGAGSASGSGLGLAVSSFALAVDSNDRPIVAWTANPAMGQRSVYIKRWSGTAWVEIGSGSATGAGVSNSTEDAYAPAVAVANDGTVTLAWIDEAWDAWGNVYVKQWNGSTWNELGLHSGSGDGIHPLSDGPAGGLSITLDQAMRPIVVWDSWADRELHGARFDGSTWLALGTDPSDLSRLTFSGTDSLGPIVAYAAEGALYLAYSEQRTSGGTVYVLGQRTDGVWQPVYPKGADWLAVSPSGVATAAHSMALDDTGRPWVATAEAEGDGYAIRVRRWNRDAWVEVGVGSATAGGVSNEVGLANSPSLTVRGHKACVAWSSEAGYSRDISVRCTTW